MSKICADYLRNGFGATTVSAGQHGQGLGWVRCFSTQCPHELQDLFSSAHWTTENIAEHIRVGNSVWGDYVRAALISNECHETAGLQKPFAHQSTHSLPANALKR